VAAKLADWDPKAVADSVRGHTWEAIVNKNLAPYLERIMGPEVGF
jgi:hypothetical protein